MPAKSLKSLFPLISPWSLFFHLSQISFSSSLSSHLHQISLSYRSFLSSLSSHLSVLEYLSDLSFLSRGVIVGYCKGSSSSNGETLGQRWYDKEIRNPQATFKGRDEPAGGVCALNVWLNVYVRFRWQAELACFRNCWENSSHKRDKGNTFSFIIFMEWNYFPIIKIMNGESVFIIALVLGILAENFKDVSVGRR